MARAGGGVIFEAERDAGSGRRGARRVRRADALRAIQRDIEAGMRAFASAPGYLRPYTAHVIAARAASLERTGSTDMARRQLLGDAWSGES